MAMQLDSFYQVVGILTSLSVASERLVEVVKGYVPFLNKVETDPAAEARRKSHVLLLSFAVNFLTTWLAWPLLSTHPAIVQLGAGGGTMIGLAFLASGGSSMWNSVLSYMSGVKDIKKAEAASSQADAQAASTRAAQQQLPIAHLLPPGAQPALGARQD